MGILAKGIGYILSAIYNLVNNYGLSIILLTLLVRVAILPLYAKQMDYTAKMNQLQPQIREIQKVYAADREKMNEKLNEIYAANNLKTTSGCLPLLIQFPIIIGLYSLLRTPLTYMTAGNMVAAVHEGFLWIPDLSQPDAWILPLLAGITTYLTSVATATSSEEMGAMSVMMKYFFPVMIFLMGRSLSAGLALYWSVGNLFTVLQTLFFNKKQKKMKMKAEAEAELKRRQKASK